MSKKVYIEKEAAIKSLEETSCYLCRKFLPDGGKCDVDCIVYRHKLVLNELPPASVAPIVRGEWKDEKIVVDSELTWTNWCCSKCGYLRKQGWTHYLGGKPVANFCENCGAAMTEEAVKMLKERSGENV